jgi:hypothetical protein
MLSFEFSAIDLILAIAVIILLILYIESSVKTSTEQKLLVEKKRPSEKPTVEDARPEKEDEKLTLEPQKYSTKCPYGFGYLKKLGKDASIPDKCLSCSRIMECFGTNE